MAVDDILPRADRVCLEVARERGSIEAVICREGVEDRDECVMHDHFRRMAKDGLLAHVSVRGTRSRRQGAELVSEFQPTTTGLRLLEAVEEIERLQAQLKPARARKERPRASA